MKNQRHGVCDLCRLLDFAESPTHEGVNKRGILSLEMNFALHNH